MLNSFHGCFPAAFCLSHSQLRSLQWVFKFSFFSTSLTGLLTSPLFQRLFLKPGPASLPIPHLFCPFTSRTMDSDMSVFAHSCAPQACNWCALRNLADTHTALCWGQNQLEQELLCSPRSDSVCLNRCWRQMSRTLGMSPTSFIRPEEFTRLMLGRSFCSGFAHLEQSVWITMGNWRDQFVRFCSGKLAHCPQHTALQRFWYSVDL